MMNLHCEITDPVTDDGLSQNVWRFTAHDQWVRLDGFRHEVRESKRHKFRGRQWWGRTDERNNNIPRPEVPEHIREQAMAMMRAKLLFGDPHYDKAARPA